MTDPKTKKKNSVCSYFQTDVFRNLLEISLIMNSGENTWSVTKETIEALLISSHEDILTTTKYTNLFLLLIYVLSHSECFLSSRYMKIDSD